MINSYTYYYEGEPASNKVQPSKKLHRLDGPAVIHSNGHKEWWVNGDLHREDGPAIEFADGTKNWLFRGQWLRDINSQEEFEHWLKLKAFW